MQAGIAGKDFYSQRWQVVCNLATGSPLFGGFSIGASASICHRCDGAPSFTWVFALDAEHGSIYSFKALKYGDLF